MLPITGRSSWATKSRIARASSGEAPVAMITRSPASRWRCSTFSATGSRRARICLAWRGRTGRSGASMSLAAVRCRPCRSTGRPRSPRRRVGSQAIIGNSSGDSSSAAATRAQWRLISHSTRWLPESPSYSVWSKSNTTSGEYGARGFPAPHSCREQPRSAAPGSGCAHEGLADQERLHAGLAHPAPRRPRVAMPLSVTSVRSRGTASRSARVVSSETSKVRRLRLLTPISSQSVLQRALEFVDVVHFDQHVHAQLHRQVGHLDQRRRPRARPRSAGCSRRRSRALRRPGTGRW